MEWDTIAAWIALVVAVISPIITCIINNKHQIKIKKLEIKEHRGLEVIENYLAVTSREIHITGVSENYRKCYAQIFLYAPEETYPDLEKLDNLICNPVNGTFPNKSDCLTLLNKISKSLS